MKDSKCDNSVTYLATDDSDRFSALLNDIESFRDIVDHPDRFRSLAYALERVRKRARELEYDLALDLEFANTCDASVDRTHARVRDLVREVDVLARTSNLELAGERLVIAEVAKPQIVSAAYCGEHLLRLLIAAPWDEAVSGDFLEMYERKLKGCAGRHLLLAKLGYWWHVLRSMPGFVRIGVRHNLRRIRYRLIKAAAKLNVRTCNTCN